MDKQCAPEDTLTLNEARQLSALILQDLEADKHVERATAPTDICTLLF